MIYNSLQGISTTMIGFVTGHLYKKMMVQKRWPSDKVNYSCENARLYTIVYHSSKRIFLALPDIKGFGHLLQCL